MNKHPFQIYEPITHNNKHTSGKKLGTILALAGSAEQTLHLDPLNTPVKLAHEAGFNVISCSLPFHDEESSPDIAIQKWYEALNRQEDPLTPFFSETAALLKAHISSDEPIALMGISRGAFAAFHLARFLPKIPVIGYAPITSFSDLPLTDVGKSFAHSRMLEPSQIIKDLKDNPIFIAIGSQDIRVGTEHCFHFHQELTSSRHHSIPCELYIGPSIGFKGHGTTFERFEMGISWLKRLRERS